ncbi:MAG: DUF2726 domain-containing protein [bacterium]
MDASILVVLVCGAMWVGVIGWAVVRWRRSRDERERERSLRFEHLIGPASKSGGRLAPHSGSAGLPISQASTLQAPPFRIRDRLLDKPATLALYAIRAAVPDHEVFVRVSLTELLDVPGAVQGYDRAQRLKKLAPLTVDFAVANKKMQLVAVIDLEDMHATVEERALLRTKAECLRELPIRHLTFSRARLPKYQDIRQLLQAPG